MKNIKRVFALLFLIIVSDFNCFAQQSAEASLEPARLIDLVEATRYQYTRSHRYQLLFKQTGQNNNRGFPEWREANIEVSKQGQYSLLDYRDHRIDDLAENKEFKESFLTLVQPDGVFAWDRGEPGAILRSFEKDEDLPEPVQTELHWRFRTDPIKYMFGSGKRTLREIFDSSGETDTWLVKKNDSQYILQLNRAVSAGLESYKVAEFTIDSSSAKSDYVVTSSQVYNKSGDLLVSTKVDYKRSGSGRLVPSRILETVDAPANTGLHNRSTLLEMHDFTLNPKFDVDYFSLESLDLPDNLLVYKIRPDGTSESLKFFKGKLLPRDVAVDFEILDSEINDVVDNIDVLPDAIESILTCPHD